MRNFFLFTMFIGIWSFQSMYAMELAHGQHDKNGIAIEMRHFWSDNYSKNICTIKDLDLKSMRSHLKKEEFLLPNASALDHLLYLSTIRKKNEVKTLFTQKQQARFDIAFKIRRSVPWFFGINGAVIFGTALFPFTNFAELSQCANSTQLECLSQIAAIMTPTVASVAAAFTVGFVSLYATGLSPDISARKANKVQDELVYLRHKYATIAKYLIDIYFECPQQAEHIVNKFDIEELKKRAQVKIYKNKAGSSLVSLLEEAWHFIKCGNVLEKFTEIETYIYYKTSCRRIEALEQENKLYCKHIEALVERVESLEKAVHGQGVEPVFFDK